MFTDDLIDCLIRFAICSCQLQVGRALAFDRPRDACGRVLGQLLSGACKDTLLHSICDERNPCMYRVRICVNIRCSLGCLCTNSCGVTDRR